MTTPGSTPSESAGSAGTPTGSRRGGRGYATKDILTIAVIAAVGGVVGALAVGPWAKFIEGVLGPFGAALNNPFHVFWPTLAALIVRKRGVAFLTSVLYGVIEVLAGSLDGSIVLVFVAVQGIGAEIGLALWHYGKSLAAAATSCGLAGVGCAFLILWVYGGTSFAPGVQVLFILAMAAGDAIIGGLLAWSISRSLGKAINP